MRGLLTQRSRSSPAWGCSRAGPAGRPAGLAVSYLMALLFVLPVFVFTSPYAAVGGLTIAHGA
jgi:hypothetical protein